MLKTQIAVHKLERQLAAQQPCSQEASPQQPPPQQFTPQQHRLFQPLAASTPRGRHGSHSTRKSLDNFLLNESIFLDA